MRTAHSALLSNSSSRRQERHQRLHAAVRARLLPEALRLVRSGEPVLAAALRQAGMARLQGRRLQRTRKTA